MRQSQTYRRSRQKGTEIDFSAYSTFRTGMAYRIQRKTHGRIRGLDAWQLAAIPAFVLWSIRKPWSFIKKRIADIKMRKALGKSNSNQSNQE